MTVTSSTPSLTIVEEDTPRTGDVEKGTPGRSAGVWRGKKLNSVSVAEAAIAEDVFVKKEGGPDYRAVGWGGALMLLLKTQIGLGVLALPNVMMTLGIVPALIVLLLLGFLTTWGDYVLGQFRERYPGVHSAPDVGFIMFGTMGRELFGAAYFLFFIFLVASGILSSSISFNAMSEHGTCTVVFAVCAAIIVAIGASARTFKQISWAGWVGVCAIVCAIMIVVIAVGISDRPPAAPPGPFDKQLRAFNNPSFSDAMVAVVNVLFAYSGTPGFFSVIAEMKNPRDYNKSMFTCQSFSMVFYVTVSIVIWFYCGQYVASPALGSAGPVVKKVAYGIALPGLLASPIVNAHLAVKFIFVRLLRGTIHLQESTKTHWVTWLGSVAFVVTFAFIIAQVIPFFDQLIGLIGAVFASFFCLNMCSMMWFHLNDNRRREGRAGILFWFQWLTAGFMFIGGLFLLVAGFYGSVVSIRDAFDTGAVGRPFSCADNSNSS